MTTSEFRPVVTVVRRAPDDTVIEVTLDRDGWIADGASAVVGNNLLAAACQATCIAVGGLLPVGVNLVYKGCSHLRGDGWTRGIVVATVALDTGDGADLEDLLGAAFVRTEPHVAAVRATLDGLTRRLGGFGDS